MTKVDVIGDEKVACVQIKMCFFFKFAVTENVLDGQVVADLPGGGVDDLPLLDLYKRVGDIGLDVHRAVTTSGLTIQLIAGGHGHHVRYANHTDGVGTGCLSVTADDTRCIAVGFRFTAVEDGVVFQIGRNVPHSTGTEGRIVPVVVISWPEAGFVVHKAVAVVVIDGEAQAEVIREGHVERTLYTPHIVIADGTLQIAFQSVGGLLGNEKNRAAVGIAAEQRTLRPFQDLDVFQVHERSRPDGIAGGGAALSSHTDDIRKIDTDGGAVTISWLKPRMAKELFSGPYRSSTESDGV